MADNPYDAVVAGMTPPTDAANPYDGIVVDMERARGQQAKTNIIAAKDANPDTAARALAVAKRLNVPVDVAERNLLDFEAIDQSNKYDEILRGSPTLKAWMSEPVNARLGTLDIPKLAGIEAGWQALGDVARSLPAGAVKGVGGGLSGLGDAWRAVGEIGVSALDAVGLPTKTFDLPWYLAPSEILGRPGGTIKSAGEAIGVPQERRNLATDVSEGVGQIGAQIAAVLATGGGTAFALMFGQGVDAMADDVKKSGKAGTFAGNAALLASGAVTGLLEKTGIDLILNRVPPAIKNKVLRGLTDLAIAGGIEAVQESIEQIAQNALANYYLDAKKDLTEGVVDAATPAGIAASLVRAMVGVGRRGRPDTAQPEADATALDKIMAAVKGSDLAGRSPEKMAEFLAGLPGGDRNVYVPAEAVREYFQKLEPEDASKLAATLGITGQLEQALATGGDVVIPLNQYMAHAPEDMATGWRDEIRLRASGMSAREAREYADGDGERAKELGETISKRAEEATRHNKARDEVVAMVERQLQIAGESPEAARQIAALYGERYVTRATRSGIAGDDAVKAYARSGVEVRSDLPAAIKHAPADDLELLIRALKNPRKDRSEASTKGPSVLQYIASAGGIIDDGGELKARDLALWHVGRPFQRKAMRDAPQPAGGGLPGIAVGDGDRSRYGADAWTLRLWEAGYFPGKTERPTPDDLYALTDRELRGEPQYSEQAEKLRDWRDDFDTAKRELDEILTSAGIDARKASVEDIRAAVEKLAAQEGVPYEQSVTLRNKRETLKKYGLDPNGSYKTREVAEALEARQRAKYGTIARDDRSSEASTKISKWMAEEVKFEMLHPDKSGVGWYGTKFQRALDRFADVYPELKTSQDARDMMTALIAITSDGAKVYPNFKMAGEIYGGFRKNGKFKAVSSTAREASVDINLKNIADLHKRLGPRGMKDYLLQEATVSELRQIAKAAGASFDTAYQAHIKLPMAAVVFGPKLGAFYANLMGSHGYLTMDRWWSRSFNRYRGTLTMSPTPQGLARFRELIGKPRLSDEKTLEATVPYAESYAARDYKNGTEIEKAANTLYKAGYENLEDQPFNSTDRTFMLDTVAKAQKRLARDGVEMSVADIQAVLWYYEKRLYGELGARQTADISYEDTAHRVAQELAPRAGRTGRSTAPSAVARAAGRPAESDSTEDAFIAEGPAQGVGKTYNQAVYHGSPQQPAPAFYSALTRGVEGVKLDKATPGQWEATIRNMPGVKPEERAWVGLDDWLRLQTKSVTKAEVLDYLRANEVQVREVMHGGKVPEYAVGALKDWAAKEADEAKDLTPADWRAVARGDVEMIEVLEGWGAPDELMAPVYDAINQGAAKFGSYVLPGGENYRELLLTLPPKEQTGREGPAGWADTNNARAREGDSNYRSSHWDEPNVLAHIRFDDRTGPNGEKVLHIAEVQSDWHQAGRKRGYREQEFRAEDLKPDGIEPGTERAEQPKYWFRLPEGRTVPGGYDRVPGWGVTPERARINALASANQSVVGAGAVPDAPFKTTWPELAFKRMLRYAAANGYDRLSWDTGETNAARFDLSQHVENIFAERRGPEYKLTVIGKNGETVYDSRASSKAEDLPDIVGKEMADRIVTDLAGEATIKTYEGLDLKVGGEGMAAFYDKQLPIIANKLGKRFGAKVEPGEVKTGDAKWEILVEGEPVGQAFDTPEEARRAFKEDVGGDNPTIRQQPGTGSATTHSITITDAMRDGVMQGQPLFQAPDGGAARGNIVFAQDAAGQTRSLITLFKDRNLSTVIHETGHLWLEELHADAALPSAPDQLKADLQTARDYLGVKGNDPLTVEQHETWARTVEAYMLEGKSPSIAMSPVMARFKAWLVSIYKTIAGLRVPISDEVRGVLDRMIATDEAIEEAKTEIGAKQLFASADQAGMTEAEFNAYTNSVTRSRDKAEQAVLGKLMDEVRARRTDEWKAETAALRDEVRGVVDSQPDIVALNYLRKGDLPESLAHLRGLPRMKLSRSELIDEYGNPEIVNALPKAVPPLVTDEGGVHPGEIAEMLGFPDGRAMIDALTALAKEKAALKAAGDKRSVRVSRIDAEVAALMKERHGDMLTDGSIEAEALSALHNEARSDVLAAELRAVARQAGKQATPYKLVRDWAKRAIAEKPVAEVADLAQYTRAEAKAARLAEQALAKGDADEALRRKQEQMISHALWIEARDAKEEIEKGRKAMDRYAGARTIKSMDQDYLEKIHDLLERFDLRPRSLKAVEKAESLREWAETQKAAGVDVAVPQKLLDEAYKTNYRRMTVEEFRGLSDSVKQIAHLGRLKQALIDGNKKREHEEVIAEAQATAAAIPQRGVSLDDTGLTPLQKRLGKMVSGLKGIDASLLKMETLVEWLDGDKTGRGVFSRMVFRPMAEAQGRERDRLKGLTDKLKVIYAKVPDSQRDRWLDVHDLPGLAKPTGSTKWNKTEILSMALNIGNESNLQKLLGGYNWDEQVLRNALNERLTKEEWQFVQDTWDLIETQWPDLAAVHRRVNGVEPPKIERTSVQTPFGELPGGYYKVAYDGNLSIKAQKIGDKQDLAATVGQIFPSGMTRPTTRAGATHERTGFEAPIRLSLDLIPQQITDAAHDIEFREAVLNAHKFLNDKRVMQAIQEAVGPEYQRQIEPWLMNVAHEWQIDRQGLSEVQKFASVMRTNVTIVGLGLRISTMLAQVAGFANSVQRLGAVDMGKGLAAFGASPLQQTEWVREKSAEMRHRANDLERDMRAAQLKMQGKTGAINDVRRLAFQGIAFMDAAVSIPTWLGAYQQGMAKGMDDGEAVYYADKMVRDTQGAGAAKDMAAIQRGGPILKLFTMFYSYFNVLYNRQRGIVRDAREGHWGSAINQTFFLMVASPLLGQFLTGQGPEDDESFAKWAARNAAFGIFAGVPYGRDIANAASNKIAGKNFGGAKLSPVEGFGENLIHLGSDTVKLLSGEDASASALKNAFNVTGVLTALPLGQIGQTSQFVWDTMVAGSQHPQNVGDWMKGLAFGPEKKK